MNKEMLLRAEELAEEVKSLELEKQKFEDLAQARIDTINEQLEGRLSRIDSNINFAMQELLNIARVSDTKEAKTQYKLELLGSDVIIKKSFKKLKNDNKAILEAIKDTRSDLVKVKETENLDWAKYKEELEIIGNVIVNKLTGEVVDVAGLEIEDVPERVEVK